MLKKTVLLTGSTGTVGHHVLDELVLCREKYNIKLLALDNTKEKEILKPYKDYVTIIWGDIRDPNVVQTAVKDTDVIVHLAALIPPTADHYPQLAWDVNVNGTKNILEAAKKENKLIKLIFSSSISIYGDRVQNPWIKVGDPLNPSVGDYYAVTKIEAEKLVKKSDIQWSIFRLSAITNPNYKLDPIMFHVPLETSIEYCLAEDAAYCIVQAIESEEILGKTYNLGGGEKCRIKYRDFVRNLINRFGIDPNILTDDLFATTNFHCGYYKDGDRLNELFAFQRGSIKDYYKQVEDKIHPFQKYLYKLIPPFLVRKYFERISEPLMAKKTGNKELLARFYGYNEN